MYNPSVSEIILLLYSTRINKNIKPKKKLITEARIITIVKRISNSFENNNVLPDIDRKKYYFGQYHTHSVDKETIIELKMEDQQKFIYM